MFLAHGLILAVTAASCLAAPVTQILKPWELTALGTFSPSGRPGSSPFSTLNATIVDSNSFLPSSANCSTQWETSPPFGKTLPCHSNNSKAKWTFSLTSGTSGTENFTIAFNLVDTKSATSVKKFTGGDHFEVGTNLSGECGGSGVCFWGLSTSPYAIHQAEK
ncbi:MAG: hypothetical protein GOMPHAMPRED_006692 [Gomphillus americanus]|uniref:AA1-like domain-containing protein n=1 Tax=Gomphillus americanus TaxID=1940652 RepID=A0A8H3G1L5_9LECA|nr:MAG: hypothetical protein GOMPHAMPRED_006692 [Gomphillus americanus]